MTEIFDGEVFLDANEKRWVNRMRRCLKDMPPGIELVTNAVSSSFTVMPAGTIDDAAASSDFSGPGDIPSSELADIEYSGASIVITDHI